MWCKPIVNIIGRKLINRFIFSYHLNAFDKIATCHYVRASQMFHTNIVKAPALFFLSKSDPIGALSANSRVRDSWENSGIKVRWNCWDKSPHVGHLRAHTQKYTEELTAFLKEVKENGRTVEAEKLRVKL